jgi:hypothetical protein
MRRRTLLVLLAGLAVVVAARVIVLWQQPDRITRENCDRIREGMTRAEVEAILGPPGDYTTWPTDITRWPRGTDWRMGDLFAEWRGDEGRILVLLDQDDGLVHSDGIFAPSSPRQVNPLYALIWRAKRQWHRWFP